ncbi:hypothetical protein ACTXT7_012384 [Hymenolepis weldensis]
MFLVGLTGGIATGKSTVSDLLKSKNVAVIDADVIARQLVDNDRQVQRAILKAFGPSVFSEDGTKVERDKLGLIVFSDPNKRKILNGIVHPVVFRRIAGQIFRHFFEGQPFVVVDIPLLFETRTMLWFVSDIIIISVYIRSVSHKHISTEEIEVGSQPTSLALMDAEREPKEEVTVLKYAHHDRPY